jgi:hypothetical protein
MNNADPYIHPQPVNRNNPDWAGCHHEGITLREYYIGQAIQGLCANPNLPKNNLMNTDIAEWPAILVQAASVVADEALKARASYINKRNPKL